MNGCLKQALFAAMTLMPMLSHGAACSTIVCRAQIVSFYFNGGSVFVELGISEAHKSEINCTLVENKYFTLTQGNSSFREIYAALLSADARDVEVELRIVEGSTNCQVGWAKMHG